MFEYCQIVLKQNMFTKHLCNMCNSLGHKCSLGCAGKVCESHSRLIINNR